jgi:DNA invertase Pin-like site-specific DNA recombinase
MRTQTRPVPSATVPALAFAPEADALDDLAAACAALGLDLVGAAADDDPLDALDEHLRCLVVRSLSDLPDLPATLARVDTDDLRLIALDIGLDTAADAGRVALRRRGRPLPPWLVEEEPAPAAAPPAPVAEEERAPAAPPAPVAEEERAPAAPPAPAAEEEPAPAAPPARAEEERAPAAPPAPVAPSAPLAEERAPLVCTRAIGYASAGGSRDGAAAAMRGQREAIEHRCERPDLELVELVGDREPKEGKALDRPGLSHVVQRIAAGEVSCVVVTGLDHLSRSVAELGRLLDWMDRLGVRLVALDLDLDTATENGRATVRALASVGAWERERLVERTRAGLAAARAKRHHPSGAAAQRTAELHRRIAAMRADGMTLQAIADVLNGEGVPTLRGGAKWRPSSVQSAAGYKRPTRTRLPAAVVEVNT